VNNELKRIWKEEQWPHLWYGPRISLEELGKIKKTTNQNIRVPGENRNGHLPNTSQVFVAWSKLLG
jgi:hypothetical protein